jgi:hypothetical protein
MLYDPLEKKKTKKRFWDFNKQSKIYERLIRLKQFSFTKALQNSKLKPFKKKR